MTRQPKRAAGPLRLVGYLRVSTEGQVTDGFGLEVQEEAVRLWISNHGHQLVAICKDEARSGKKDLTERLGLAEALVHLSAKRADGIVVFKLDRLARDLVLQEQLLREIWQTGGEVFSTAGGEGNIRNDPDDPSRKLIRQVLGAVSEYERDMIVLRLQRGRALKGAKGGYAFGSPHFGVLAEDGALRQAPAEQAVVDRILQLHSTGASLREIAAALEHEGRSAKRGDRWYPMTVRRVIARYSGPRT